MPVHPQPSTVPRPRPRTDAYDAPMSTEIRPFTVEVADAEIDDLRDRLARTRWPEPEVVDDWTQGIPLAYLQDVCEYWADGYDWRRCEAAINAPAQLRHRRRRARHSLPARPLGPRRRSADGRHPRLARIGAGVRPDHRPARRPDRPRRHRRRRLPSGAAVRCPATGSAPSRRAPGTGVERIAAMWDELMGRLGYESYVAQGGDWGSAVTTQIGMQNLGRCRAIHTNMPVAGPSKESMADSPTRSRPRWSRWATTTSGTPATPSSSRAAPRPSATACGLTGGPGRVDPGEVLVVDRPQRPPRGLLQPRPVARQRVAVWFTAPAPRRPLYWESFGSSPRRR